MKRIEIEKNWNKQPFLEKYIFLMNELKLNEEDAGKIAKLNFNEIDEWYIIEIEMFFKK
jgi:hypothetical protein